MAEEIKHDGARALSLVTGDQILIQSRPGNSFTGRFPDIAAALAGRLAGHSAIVDGELVALGADGRPDFGRLQRRLHLHRPSTLQQRATPTRLWLFDILHLDGRDLTALPYRQRRRVLEDLLPGTSGPVAVPPAWSDISGPELHSIAAELAVEGTVAKRADSIYQPGRRTRNWIKSPIRLRSLIGVLGYVPGRTTPVGALLLGGYDPATGRLIYCGAVSAGLGPRISRNLYTAFQQRRAGAPPWSREDGVGEDGSAVRWLRPGCLAIVEYREFTASGRFRHAAFRGLHLSEDPDWAELPSPVRDA